MLNNNQFIQRNSESKKQNENVDNISYKSNLNLKEEITNDGSNEFSIFHIGNAFEKDKSFKNENKTKKDNFYPFFGGKVHENPTEETPDTKDNFDIFKGEQIENELQIYKNITKGGDIDNNLETDKGYTSDLDNKDKSISHSEIHNNNNIDNNNINNNSINNNNINNIYNNNKGEDKEVEKIYSNNGNYQQDTFYDYSEFASHYDYIKNYCEKSKRFPFFLKIDENEPEFILANKKLTLREILSNKNIYVENIDLYCKDYQKKVFLDETIESQNIRPFSYIQNNIN